MPMSERFVTRGFAGRRGRGIEGKAQHFTKDFPASPQGRRRGQI
ncbi:MAG TPA: hypothetical protein VGR87_10815 [Candidatus Limnocylindria bacterium]|nr:hypothetical protein [Candidatus Limnocylindria bacterium]